MHCPHAYIVSILFTGPSPQPFIAVILLFVVIHFLYLFFVCTCIPTCLHEFICTVCVQIPKEAQDVEFPGTKVSGSCDPPDMGVEN